MSLGLERDEQLGGFSLGVTVDDDDNPNWVIRERFYPSSICEVGSIPRCDCRQIPKSSCVPFWKLRQSLCKSLSIE